MKKNQKIFSSKIIKIDEIEDNQNNKLWWQNNPMTYDWDGTW